MKKTGRLELTWVGKYDEKVIEPRILVQYLFNSSTIFKICATMSL